MNLLTNIVVQKLCLNKLWKILLYFWQMKSLCSIKNPILKPLLQNLVFIHDNDIGYFQNNSLISPTKDIIKLNADDKIRIAHPIDLYKRQSMDIYISKIYLHVKLNNHSNKFSVNYI